MVREPVPLYQRHCRFGSHEQFLLGQAVQQSTAVNWNIFKFYPVKISGATVLRRERSGTLYMDSSLCVSWTFWSTLVSKAFGLVCAL